MFVVLALLMVFQAPTTLQSKAVEAQSLAARLTTIRERSATKLDGYSQQAEPAPAAGSNTQMFDLICTGRREVASRRPTSLPDLRFRIDLTTSRYCVGPCTDMRTLTVYPTTLVFVQHDGLIGETRMQTRQSVDRHTGAFEFTGIANGRLARQETGQCTVAPYTGQVRGQRLF